MQNRFPPLQTVNWQPVPCRTPSLTGDHVSVPPFLEGARGSLQGSCPVYPDHHPVKQAWLVANHIGSFLAKWGFWTRVSWPLHGCCNHYTTVSLWLLCSYSCIDLRRQEAAFYQVRSLVHPAQYCLHILAAAVQGCRKRAPSVLPGQVARK